MQWLLDVDGKDTGSRLCLVDGGLTVGFLTNSQFVIWYIIHDILFDLVINKSLSSKVCGVEKIFVYRDNCIRSLVSYVSIRFHFREEENLFGDTMIM